MKKRYFIVLFSLLLLLSIYQVYSHEEEESLMKQPSAYFPLSQLSAFGYGSLIFGILIVITLLFHKKMSEAAKRITFYLIVIVASLVTIYIALATLNLNLVSETKGPVHWHADYEIWVCGKEIEIAMPKNIFSNKQGTDLMHSHEDKRIHVEGTLLDKKAASLGAFFHAVRGSLSDDGMTVPTDAGVVSVHDGDSCNGNPGKLYVFVNGKIINNPSNYVISQYEKVPPGDRIKIIFTEKPIKDIDIYIKGDTNRGIKLGSESEKFFDEVENRMKKIPHGEPMTTSNKPLCDLNNDGACDNGDLRIFETSMGKCANDFQSVADATADYDSDGCVTSKDKQIFLQFLEQYKENKKH